MLDVMHETSVVILLKLYLYFPDSIMMLLCLDYENEFTIIIMHVHNVHFVLCVFILACLSSSSIVACLSSSSKPGRPMGTLQ